AQDMEFERAGHAHEVTHADAVIQVVEGLRIEEGTHLFGAQVEAVDRLYQANLAQAGVHHTQAFKGRVVRGFHVVCPGEGERIGQRQAPLAARFVHGELLPLGVDGEALRPLADLLGGALDAVGQDVAQPFTPRDLVDHGDHGVGVAKGQFDAVCVFLGEDAIFIAFHGKSDGHAGRNAVQHIAIDPLRRFGNGCQVSHATDRTQRTDDLIFPAAIFGRHAALRHFDLALACHQTGVAGAAVDQDRVAHGLAGDLFGIFKGSVAEVARGQDAVAIEALDPPGCAVQVHPVMFFVIVVAEPLDGFELAVTVYGGDALPPARDDGLEVLAAHDRPQPGAAMEVAQLVDNGGIAHAVLPAHAGLQHADAAVP